ncbi:MAG: MarR family winged helix-turn-helix transcriptional regulator [Novosphingobium sp.]
MDAVFMSKDAQVDNEVSAGDGKDAATRKRLDNSLRFAFLIHDVSRMRRIVVDRALKPLGMTRSQWWVLAFLSRRDGMKMTALAADLDLTKVAVGGLVERMESAGYVERRSDERDARAKRVYLTAEGQSLVNRIRSRVETVETDILATISEQELDGAAETLVKIKYRLQELLDEDTESAAPRKRAGKASDGEKK